MATTIMSDTPTKTKKQELQELIAEADGYAKEFQNDYAKVQKEIDSLSAITDLVESAKVAPTIEALKATQQRLRKDYADMLKAREAFQEQLIPILATEGRAADFARIEALEKEIAAIANKHNAKAKALAEDLMKHSALFDEYNQLLHKRYILEEPDKVALYERNQFSDWFTRGHRLQFSGNYYPTGIDCKVAYSTLQKAIKPNEFGFSGWVQVPESIAVLPPYHALDSDGKGYHINRPLGNT